MTRGVIADIVDSLRSRASRSWNNTAGNHQPTGNRQATGKYPSAGEHQFTGEHHSAGEHEPSGDVICAVVTCLQCGRQRPYPVSREEFAAGDVPYWFEQGISLHLEIRHDLDDGDRDEVVDSVVAAAELREVSTDVLDDVESRNQKWNEYGL